MELTTLRFTSLRQYIVLVLILNLGLGLGCNFASSLGDDTLADLEAVPTRTPQPTFTVGPTETPIIISTATPIPTQPPTNTPEPEKQPEPPATPVPILAEINVNAANVRNGPGTNYSRIGRAVAGEVYEVLGRNNDNTWIVIKYQDDQAWLFASLANITGDINTLSVIEASAAPAPVAQAPAPSPPTATPVPPQQAVAPPQPQYQYTVHNVFGGKNEAITQIRGYIGHANNGDAGVNGVRVQVQSGTFCTVSYPSGPVGNYPNGNYDILLDNKAKPGRWQIAVVDRPTNPDENSCDLNANALSEEITVDTNFDESVIWVEYRKNF